MAGRITTGVSFDIELFNDGKKIAEEMDIPFSRLVQISLRNQIKLHRKQSVQQYIDSLNESEKSLLKKLLG